MHWPTVWYVHPPVFLTTSPVVEELVEAEEHHPEPNRNERSLFLFNSRDTQEQADAISQYSWISLFRILRGNEKYFEIATGK